MSFIGVVKEDLAEVEQAALGAAKTSLNYIEGVLTQDLLPVLEKALLDAIERLGQEALAALLGKAAPASTDAPPAA